MNRRVLVVTAIILAALTAVGAYLYRHIESYPRHINTGPSLNVMLNPWFAAQRFLEKQNIASHRAFDLQAVLHRLEADDTLILFNDTPLYNPGSQRRLREWMESGGHLIITANYEWDDEDGSSGDPFLDSFGVRLNWVGAPRGESGDEEFDTEDEDGEDTDDHDSEDIDAQNADTDTDANADNIEADEVDTEEFEAENQASNPNSEGHNEDHNNAGQNAAPDATASTEAAAGSTQCGADADIEPFKVRYKDSPTPLIADFGFRYTLDDASGQSTGNSDHWPNGVLQYKAGAGMMTVMLDTAIWENPNIGDYDHAFLLWYLVGSEKVWFVSSNDSDNLLSMLWRNASYWMLGLAAMLLVWGWRRWVRFGPMVPDPATDRRQLLEHIEAESLFRWQHRQMEPLLKSVRDQIWLRLSQAHGIQNHTGQSQIDKNQIGQNQGGQHDSALQKLAEISQQPLEQIRFAMTCEVPARELQWVELISLLQTIRNAL